MPYEIRCICGATVTVPAESETQAVQKLVLAMDQHLASAAHPDVPKNLTLEQKTAMVKSQMKTV